MKHIVSVAIISSFVLYAFAAPDRSEYLLNDRTVAETVKGYRLAEDEPALPACGEYQWDVTYGPVTEATTYDWGCDHEYEDRNFLAASYYKKKTHYEFGNKWKCFRTFSNDPLCHTYLLENCPGDTCFNANVD